MHVSSSTLAGIPVHERYYFIMSSGLIRKSHAKLLQVCECGNATWLIQRNRNGNLYVPGTIL